jgi:RNA 3'-terminal phosphate cyclase (ATP)
MISFSKHYKISTMIDIDGSDGEGGGQILRTSLSLAAITGKPVTITNIRAKRKKPGLAAQHLTAVRAAAKICNADLQGDALGSTTLKFVPQTAVQSGNYNFDVMEASESGSAGSVALVLQTILLPLALAKDDSLVILKGGTHVSYSPAIAYIERVYLPMLLRMGIDAQIKLNAWGWYPQGGGEVELRVKGNTSNLRGINIIERGDLQKVEGLAVVTELPANIPQRMVNRAVNLLDTENIKTNIQPLRAKGIAAGAGLFLTAEYENSLAGFGALGRLGLSAEKVAEIACEEFIKFHQISAPIDEHLADQLLLPAVLAAEASQYRVAEVTSHLTTNAWVIEQFGLARVVIGDDKIVKVQLAI